MKISGKVQDGKFKQGCGFFVTSFPLSENTIELRGKCVITAEGKQYPGIGRTEYWDTVGYTLSIYSDERLPSGIDVEIERTYIDNSSGRFIDVFSAEVFE